MVRVMSKEALKAECGGGVRVVVSSVNESVSAMNEHVQASIESELANDPRAGAASSGSFEESGLSDDEDKRIAGTKVGLLRTQRLPNQLVTEVHVQHFGGV